MRLGFRRCFPEIIFSSRRGRISSKSVSVTTTTCSWPGFVTGGFAGPERGLNGGSVATIAQGSDPNRQVKMMPSGERPAANAAPRWSLLSPHGLVLFFLAIHPDSTLRDMAQQLGLTERTLYTMIRDLSSANMVRAARVGRHNSYKVNVDAHFVHPMFAHLRIGNFLDILKPPSAGDAPEEPQATRFGVG